MVKGGIAEVCEVAMEEGDPSCYGVLRAEACLRAKAATLLRLPQAAIEHQRRRRVRELS